MGTTMTVALVEDGGVAIGHVGDSRAYLVRDRKARAADRRPLARRRARAQRPAHARGGGHPPAALGDHPRGRHRPGRRRRHVLGRGRSRATSSCSAPTGSRHGRRRDDPRRRRAAAATTSTRPRRRSIERANRGGGEDNISRPLRDRPTTAPERSRPRRRRCPSSHGDRRRRSRGRRGHAHRARRASPARRHDRSSRRRRRARRTRGPSRRRSRRAERFGVRAARLVSRSRSSPVLVAARLTGCSARAGWSLAPQPRARQPARRRPAHRPRLRERLHRAPGVVSAGSLSYAALLLRPLPRRAHGRPLAVPYADPYLLPLGGAADGGRPDGDLPARPRRRVPPGPLGRRRGRRLRRTLIALRHDYRRLESYKYLFGLDRDRAARCCPRCRASARR